MDCGEWCARCAFACRHGIVGSGPAAAGHFGAEHAHLIGESLIGGYGGAFALQVLVEEPELFRGVVAENVVGRSEELPQRGGGMLLAVTS